MLSGHRSASGCTMTNAANLGAFVQATILNPGTGALSVYNELLAARNMPRVPAPASRRTTRWCWTPRATSTRPRPNLYRAEVGQAPVSPQNDKFDSPSNYCQNMINIQGPFLAANQAAFAGGPSPMPAVGEDLYTFLANRLRRAPKSLALMVFRSTVKLAANCADMPAQALKPAAFHPNKGSTMELVPIVANAVAIEIDAISRERPLASRK